MRYKADFQPSYLLDPVTRLTYTNHTTLMRYNSCARNNIHGTSTRIANFSWISVHMRLLRTPGTSAIRSLSKMGRKTLHFPSPKRTTMEATIITMMGQVRKTWKKSTRKPVISRRFCGMRCYSRNLSATGRSIACQHQCVMNLWHVY